MSKVRFCLICEKRPANPNTDGGLLCIDCERRRNTPPPHVHHFTETWRTGGDNPIIYSECECGERNMGTLN
jgi:hypothetical protein